LLIHTDDATNQATSFQHFVNTPPAKTGGFRLRLNAGLISHSAYDSPLPLGEGEFKDNALFLHPSSYLSPQEEGTLRSGSCGQINHQWTP